MEALQEVTLDDPALSAGHLWLALARTELGLHDEAVQAGIQAVRLSRTSSTLSAHAYVLARAGRREDAESILDLLLVDPPYSYVSPLQLAAVAHALGREEEASAHLVNAHTGDTLALLWRDVDPRIARIRRFGDQG
jgi:hypothetical protein